MPVYVDFQATGLCDMLADTPDELHAMAGRVGLGRGRYTPPGKAHAPHYRISTQARGKAISLGAKKLLADEMKLKRTEINATADIHGWERWGKDA